MKITFLGTSHGVPGEDRYCQSMLIEENDAGYLIDAGAPVIDILIRRNYPLSKIKSVFITHVHGDHINGLISLLDLANWYYKDMCLDVFLPENRAIELIGEFLELSHNYKPLSERIKFRFYDEGEIYYDNNIKIEAFGTNHLTEYNKPTYGFVINSKDKKICVSGDLHRTLTDFPKLSDKEPADLFIVECAHFEPDKLVEKFLCCNAKQFAPVHVYPLDKLA